MSFIAIDSFHNFKMLLLSSPSYPPMDDGMTMMTSHATRYLKNGYVHSGTVLNVWIVFNWIRDSKYFYVKQDCTS